MKLDHHILMCGPIILLYFPHTHINFCPKNKGCDKRKNVQDLVFFLLLEGGGGIISLYL